MTRPKKETLKKKKNCIMLRLSDPEYELVANYAKESGYPIAVYARKQVLEGKIEIQCPIIVDIEELRKLTTEFGRVGNNLNQIAKYFNMGGIRSQAMQDEIHECITQLFSLREEVLRLAGDYHSNIEAHRK